MVNIEKTHKNYGKSDLRIEFDLSIIVISFNTREMTLECLNSIRIQTQNVSYETIVVDNDSRTTHLTLFGINFLMFG